jgi:hypothetical protein
MVGDGDRFVTSPGTVVVHMYDVSNGQEPRELERWVFDPESLKKLVKQDGWGWGYDLILPWGTYRPDITKVEMRTHLDRPNLPPLYSGSSTVSLLQPDHHQPLPGSEAQKPPQLLVPAARQQMPPMGVQQTSLMTTGPMNMGPAASGVQPAFQSTPSALPLSAPSSTIPTPNAQMSREQIQAIVYQYQLQSQQTPRQSQ